jgi:putative flippase GtrA
MREPAPSRFDSSSIERFIRSGVDYRIANLAGIALGTLVNFTAGELWIFRAGRRGVSED